MHDKLLSRCSTRAPRSFVLRILVLPLAYLVGCAQDRQDTTDNPNPVVEDSNVLARVGESPITVEDLYRFTANMPAVLRSEEEGAAAVRDYLQSMIDKELMLREARTLSFSNDPVFISAWERGLEAKLVQEYLTRNFSPETEDKNVETWRERFVTSKWSRLLKLAHIRVASQVQALGIIRDLEDGGSFATAAKEHSTSENTAIHGGEIDFYFGRGNLGDLGLPLLVAEEIFELPVGAVSRPLKVGDSYEIFTVIDEQQAPEWYLPVFVRVEVERRYLDWRDDLVARLASGYSVRMEPEAVSVLVNKGSGGGQLELSASEQGLVLCRFGDSEHALADFERAYTSFSTFRSIEFDSTGIAGFAVSHLLQDALLARAATDDGLHEAPDVAAWLETKRENMLIEALRRRQVDDRITVTEESIRRYYEENLNRFMKPAEIGIAEILVPTREEGERLAAKIRNGADIRVLAEQHSIREDVVREDGVFHMHPYERVAFGEILDVAENAEVGQLQGPIEVGEGFSVFEVVEKIPPHPDSFESARSRAEFWVKDQQEWQYFGELLSRLRKNYASEVVMYEDRMHAVGI